MTWTSFIAFKRDVSPWWADGSSDATLGRGRIVLHVLLSSGTESVAQTDTVASVSSPVSALCECHVSLVCDLSSFYSRLDGTYKLERIAVPYVHASGETLQEVSARTRVHAARGQQNGSISFTVPSRPGSSAYHLLWLCTGSLCFPMWCTVDS